MERIERLERANRLWRFVSFLSFAAILIVGSYAYSQREPQKAPPPQAQAPATNTAVDSAPAPVTYTNFVRVSVTPEEFVLDLGLNIDSAPDAHKSVRTSNRIVMNYYTAKRLTGALQNVVQAHETAYGPLELDFQKRLLPGQKAP